MKSSKLTAIGAASDRRWYDDACGTALGLELVGERWALLVVRELMFGPRRFGELRVNLPGISANVLTQRLDGLEAAGIVRRYRLPSPANVQVYDLTDWGREAEVVVRELGRWAARSPRHDPFAFLSTASAMISLRTLLRPERAVGVAMTGAFLFPDDRFVFRLRDGDLAIARGEASGPEVVFTGDTMAMRRSIYGGEGFGGDGLLAVAGDREAAHRFAALFELPARVA